MQWFKFYGAEYLSDPKMLSLTPCERSCWITLLSFASVGEDGGRIKYLTETQLMIQSGLDLTDDDWGVTSGVLEKLAKLDMVLLDSNGDITIKNWNKRQETYLTNAERQKRYREKQKSNAIVTPVLQHSNAREKERIEREKEKGEFSKENGEELGREQRLAKLATIRATLTASKKI